jgi:hypothetical protein
MLGWIVQWGAVAGGALVAGAGLGFLARDILDLGQPTVAVAWLVGVAAGIAVDRRTAGTVATIGRGRRSGPRKGGGAAG